MPRPVSGGKSRFSVKLFCCLLNSHTHLCIRQQPVKGRAELAKSPLLLLNCRAERVTVLQQQATWCGADLASTRSVEMIGLTKWLPRLGSPFAECPFPLAAGTSAACTNARARSQRRRKHYAPDGATLLAWQRGIARMHVKMSGRRVATGAIITQWPAPYDLQRQLMNCALLLAFFEPQGSPADSRAAGLSACHPGSTAMADGGISPAIPPAGSTKLMWLENRLRQSVLPDALSN